MMDNTVTDFITSLKDNLERFLNNMSENNYSYFKYTYSGDILDRSKKWGLGNLVFATKILFITRLLDNISSIKKKNLYKSILKFSQTNGYIYDPFITKISYKQRLKKYFNKLDNTTINYIENTRRAETRQSFTALHLLQRKPLKPFLRIPYSKEEISNYLSSFNWKYPWAAGSHFSHLLFFLHYNAEFFNYKIEESRDLINYAVEWISRLQSKHDGTWYHGSDISLKEKINGAMKILTGLHAAEIYDFPYADKLIDTALTGINDSEACSNFNIVYVLYGCQKNIANYRKNEILDFIKNRISLYKEFYYSNKGGFAFHKNKANDIYYAKKISQGKDEPDIHGTIMFIWGLAIINSMIDIGLDFEIPVN